jgi:hypothetical protein
MFPDSPFLPTFPRQLLERPSGAPHRERVPETFPTYHPLVRPRPQEHPKRVQPWIPMRPSPIEPATEPEFEPEDSLA